MRVSHQIVLASNNRDKFEEFSALLKAYPEIELLPASKILRNASNLGWVEKHHTYLDNAVAKARLANQGAHYPCLADDSGLEVMILEGKPGPRSARYAIAKDGVPQSQANTEKLLNEMKGYPKEKRKARFVCALALVMEGVLVHANGTLDGMIAEAPKGTNGFGYDPVFIPDGSSLTLAEMSDYEKNSISHRGRALNELMYEIKTMGILFARP